MMTDRHTNTESRHIAGEEEIRAAFFQGLLSTFDAAQVPPVKPDQEETTATERTIRNERDCAIGAFEFFIDRFDSITAACEWLQDAESIYGFPFGEETDHLFLYTKGCRCELSYPNGYALFIRRGLLFYFSERAGSDDALRLSAVSEVEPHALIDFLNACNGILKDDTVIEQMNWVQMAQEEGLLASDYPAFVTGAVGSCSWLAVPEGAPLPKGFAGYPTAV